MKIRFYFLAFSVLLFLAGCAPPPPQLRILWPNPTMEEPRLEFLGSYASQNDFPKTGWQTFIESIVGLPALDFFRMPMDLVMDSHGRVYVSDMYLGNIRVYDFVAKTNHLLTDNNSLLSKPIGLAIDSHDRLYVADGEAGQIVVFNAEHQLLQFIKHPDLVRPAYLAVDDSKDRLYVSDGKDSKILIFDLSGKLIKTFGQGQVILPQGIAVSSDGRIFVAEALMARISIFSAEGEYITSFGERGDTVAQFDNPKDIAFGPDGLLFILDARKPGLLVFDKDQQALLALGTSRRDGSALSLDSPAGLFVSASGQILIADRLRRRFSIWQLLTPQYLAEHPITAEDLQRIKAATIAGGGIAPADGSKK